MSKASEIYTIVGALKRAEEKMCLKKSWKFENKIQERFLEGFLKVCRDDKVKEIEFEVSGMAEIINEFLQKKGFSIRLQPFPANTIGFASVLDLIVEWLHPGEKGIIDANNGGRYESVRIKKDDVSFYESTVRGYKHIVACIKTRSGDMVFITVPKEPLEGLDLLELADDVYKNMDILSPAIYEGLRFPMVDLDVTNDLGWLKGMSTTNGMDTPAEITQAVNQIKIKMNEKGARFQSATAMAVTFRCVTMPQDLIIREPFLLWVGRHELEKPLMAAFVTEESWKNPGNLV